MSFEEWYRTEAPPWEIGRPQPAVVRLGAQRAFVGSVLDVGCGTGENTLHLASLGHETWGVDFAPTAVERARVKAFARRLPAVFLEADALDLAALGRTFDTALDSGCFHTFDDADREQYVQSLRSVIVPGGRLHLLCFSEHEPGDWGPRRVTVAEIHGAFTDGWAVEAVVPERFANRFGPQGAAAWLATIIRA